jgi:hypothetical protein
MKVAAEEKGLYPAHVHLARDNKEARGPILAMFREAGLLPKAAKKGEETDQKACGDDMVAGKQAGCEKLPEALRKNCEEKAGGGDDEKKDDDKDEKKKEAALRSALIRLANENPAFRGRIVPMIVAHDKERAATR